ncbi:MAG: nucleoside hydrolase [Clostridiales bacterium]|jgi:inosine-uridine nucleoside N-ribohydrolase|nr:nucleoside hydrolase [Clostridiales bacterium]
MSKYRFTVPEKKKIRVIIDTDCKNEADDQYVIAHFLMTQKFIVEGIVAAHFELNHFLYGKGNTMKASFDEIKKVVSLMGLHEDYKDKIFPGSPFPLQGKPIEQFSFHAAHSKPKELFGEISPAPSEGSKFIIQEALRDDDRPLYIVCIGTLTNLASAILENPEICNRATAIWSGGGPYPAGGFEFNLMQDIAAANVVFSSAMPLWQIPENVYKNHEVSLAELQVRVAPYGQIGEYLFAQMVDFNDKMADIIAWPHGESWGLGDQGTVTVLLEENRRGNYDWTPAPIISPEMFYVQNPASRPIKVYNRLDARFTMEDFYAKIKINYGE